MQSKKNFDRKYGPAKKLSLQKEVIITSPGTEPSRKPPADQARLPLFLPCFYAIILILKNKFNSVGRVKFLLAGILAGRCFRSSLVVTSLAVILELAALAEV